MRNLFWFSLVLACSSQFVVNTATMAMNEEKETVQVIQHYRFKDRVNGEIVNMVPGQLLYEGETTVKYFSKDEWVAIESPACFIFEGKKYGSPTKSFSKAIKAYRNPHADLIVGKLEQKQYGDRDIFIRVTVNNMREVDDVLNSDEAASTLSQIYQCDYHGFKAIPDFVADHIIKYIGINDFRILDK